MSWDRERAFNKFPIQTRSTWHLTEAERCRESEGRRENCRRSQVWGKMAQTRKCLSHFIWTCSTSHSATSSLLIIHAMLWSENVYESNWIIKCDDGRQKEIFEFIRCLRMIHLLPCLYCYYYCRMLRYQTEWRMLHSKWHQ